MYKRYSFIMIILGTLTLNNTFAAACSEKAFGKSVVNELVIRMNTSEITEEQMEEDILEVKKAYCATLSTNKIIDFNDFDIEVIEGDYSVTISNTYTVFDGVIPRGSSYCPISWMNGIGEKLKEMGYSIEKKDPIVFSNCP